MKTKILISKSLYLISFSLWVWVLDNEQRDWEKFKGHKELVLEKDHEYIMIREDNKWSVLPSTQ